MRGLTDAEYDLVRFAGSTEERWHNASDTPAVMSADLALEARGLLVVTVTDARRGWWDTTITPLGRLALSLWPAIRSGQ